MSSIDLRAATGRASPPSAVARPKNWRKAVLSCLGGFVLTGVCLGFGAALFGIAGVYAFIEFAKLY